MSREQVDLLITFADSGSVPGENAGSFRPALEFQDHPLYAEPSHQLTGVQLLRLGAAKEPALDRLEFDLRGIVTRQGKNRLDRKRPVDHVLDLA